MKHRLRGNAPTLLTVAGADVWGALSIITPGARGEADALLPHPFDLQVEEQARLTGKTAIQGRARVATRWTEFIHRKATCGLKRH